MKTKTDEPGLATALILIPPEDIVRLCESFTSTTASLNLEDNSLDLKVDGVVDVDKDLVDEEKTDRPKESEERTANGDIWISVGKF